MSNYNTKLNTNNTELQGILDIINNLPEAGGGNLEGDSNSISKILNPIAGGTFREATNKNDIYSYNFENFSPTSATMFFSTELNNSERCQAPMCYYNYGNLNDMKIELNDTHFELFLDDCTLMRSGLQYDDWMNPGISIMMIISFCDGETVLSDFFYVEVSQYDFT
jgi:hypothetical protein